VPQITAYTDLYPLLYRELPGVDNPTLLTELQRAARQFCLDTEAWHEELNPIAAVDWQSDYTLSHNYSASVHRIRDVWLNGAHQDGDEYDLLEEDTLRWRGGHVPHDLSDRLLTCGSIGTATLANWTAISDASYTITMGGGTHSVTEVDLSGCADFDAVAQALQAGLRGEYESNVGYCRAIYSDADKATVTHFVFWLKTSDIGVLTAGASGTDISGAGYLNGLTGSGSIAPHILVDAVFRPHIRVDTLPHWFLDRYAEALQAHTIWILAKQQKKAWTDATVATTWKDVYDERVSEAKMDNDVEFKSKPMEMRG